MSTSAMADLSVLPPSGSRMKRSVSTMTLPVETSSSLVIPHENPTKRNNPSELHWRSNGPKWIGNMDKAWGGKYAHLEGEDYCRYCGAVPCPLDHDDLKDTRLKDLEFVREIVKDKKELEEKHAKLDQSMKKLVQDTEGWRGEKAMLLEELKLADRRKQEWDFERRLMEAELNRLKSINDKQLNKLADFRKEQQKVVAMNRRLKLMEEENAKLTAEVQRTRQLLVSQLDETEKVRKDNKRLIVELESSEATIRILKVQVDEANEQRRIAEEKLATGEDRMRQVEEEIRNILKDLEVKTKHFEEKDNLSQVLIRELRNQMLELKARLDESERYQCDLQEQIDAYLQEIEKLRLKLGSDKRFQMFVAIKRECNGLKERNEALVNKGSLGHAYSIPFLNANGRVTSPLGRQGSPSLQLRRAKSASAFTSRERLYSHRKIRDTLKLDNL